MRAQLNHSAGRRRTAEVYTDDFPMIAAGRSRRPSSGARPPRASGRAMGAWCVRAKPNVRADDSRRRSTAADLRNARRKSDHRVERRWRLDPRRPLPRRVPSRRGVLRRRLRREGRYLAGFTSGKVTLRAEDAPGDYRALAEFASQGTGKKPILVGVSGRRRVVRCWPRPIRKRRPRLRESWPSAFRPGPSSAGGGATRSSISRTACPTSRPSAPRELVGKVRTVAPRRDSLVATTNSSAPTTSEKLMRGRIRRRKSGSVAAADHRFSDNVAGVRPAPRRGDRLDRTPANLTRPDAPADRPGPAGDRRPRRCFWRRSACCAPSCAASAGTELIADIFLDAAVAPRPRDRPHHRQLRRCSPATTLFALAYVARPAVVVARGARVVSRVCDRQRRRVLDALGGVGEVPASTRAGASRPRT